MADSSFVYTIILGVVEGLTEFIPVSSTGHLIIVDKLLGLGGEKQATFDIVIQLGAILAAVYLFFPRFLALIPSKSSKAGGFVGVDGIIKLLAVTFPALVAGFLLHDFIKAKLFDPRCTAVALILGGVVMIVVERRGTSQSIDAIDEISFWRCFKIGIFQCFSLWPGISRSGATIIGGMLCGLDRKVATEFSFIAAVPIMVAAVGYDVLKSLSILSISDFSTFAVGFMVSFVTAIAAIKLLVSVVSKYSLEIFAYYRIILGIAVLLMVR